jgi:hypothetical protein
VANTRFQETKPILRGVYAKQSQFAGSPNNGLSFLRKQESRRLGSPGFRIKCGMTGIQACLAGYSRAKQSQSVRNDLPDRFLGPDYVKQSQFEKGE